MPASNAFTNTLQEDLDDKLVASPASQRSNALSTKLTSVLAASYADSEIRDALRALDEKGIKNTAQTRRGIRLEIQKELIERNGDIIKDFGHVAEVRSPVYVYECQH